MTETGGGGEVAGLCGRPCNYHHRGVRRVWERLGAAVNRAWLVVIPLMGIGLLPCPDCGGRLIVHYWPIAGLVLAVQALRRRRRAQSGADDEE